MSRLDPVYILKLINASNLLTPVQKAGIKEKLPVFSVSDLVALQEMLEKEQKIDKAYYDQIGGIRKRSSEKKKKVIYAHAEKQLKKVDEEVLAGLDAELAQISG